MGLLGATMLLGQLGVLSLCTQSGTFAPAHAVPSPPPRTLPVTGGSSAPPAAHKPMAQVADTAVTAPSDAEPQTEPDVTLFWGQVVQQLAEAPPGQEVVVLAGVHDNLPVQVMEALAHRPDLSLVIRRSANPIISIPAGTAKATEPGRIYWPLNVLDGLYRE